MPDADDVHGLIAQLHDVYAVEQQLRRVIVKLSRRASASSVRQAFETHLTAIWREIVRLESVFEWLEAGAGERRARDEASQTGMRTVSRLAEMPRDPVREERGRQRRSQSQHMDPSAAQDDAGPADHRAAGGSTPTRLWAESAPTQKSGRSR